MDTLVTKPVFMGNNLSRGLQKITFHENEFNPCGYSTAKGSTDLRPPWAAPFSFQWQPCPWLLWSNSCIFKASEFCLFDMKSSLNKSIPS